MYIIYKVLICMCLCCMCVCIYTCMYICMYIHIHIYTYIHIYIYALESPFQFPPPLLLPKAEVGVALSSKGGEKGGITPSGSSSSLQSTSSPLTFMVASTALHHASFILTDFVFCTEISLWTLYFVRLIMVFFFCTT